MPDVEEGRAETDKIPREQVPWWAWCGMACGLLSLVILGLSVATQTYPLLALAALLYLVSVIEAFCSSAFTHLRNVMSERDFKQHMDKVMRAEPVIRYHIRNYHYEERIEKDAEGNETRTEERVDTHVASRVYGIRSSLDETLSPMQTCAMFHLLNDPGMSDADLSEKASNTKGLLLLCHMPLRLHPVSDSDWQHYEDDRESFYRFERRDVHCDTYEDRALTCSQPEHLLVILSGGTEDSYSKPWWMNGCVYVVAALFFGMSAVFRWVMYSQCQLTVWPVVKHFSPRVVDFDQEVPISSRQHRDDPASLAFQKVPREKSGHSNRPPQLAQPLPLAPLERRSEPLAISEAPPSYWQCQDTDAGFDEKVKLTGDEVAMFQSMVDQTFKHKATRDRKNSRMPARLKVECVIRMEDSKMWQRYAAKRAEMGEFSPVLLQDLPGSGAAKTEGPMSAIVPSGDAVPGVNEMYLFHGTGPAGALGIGENGFDMGRAGSNVGTMFGAGAYLAEASSKSDEYAQTDGSGVFEGMYALLLCRTVLGSTFYIDESNIPAIEAALGTGAYHSVLGDREARVGTYREFVVFDEAQLYPEYAIIYKRCYVSPGAAE